VNSCTVIDWLKGLATPTIAVAGIAIVCAQLRIANVRLTHDLFDRRYAVFAAERKFIQQICQKRTITIDELSSFHYASVDVIFVCDQGVADYLEKLRTNAVRAAELYEKIGCQNASRAEIQEHWDLLNWASSQIDTLTEKFKPFLQYSRPWSKRPKIIGGAALFLVLLVDTAVAENAFSPPTATEIYHLRSECAALGEKLLDADVVGAALYKSQISRYNPQMNRCYVELTAQTADTTKPLSYVGRSLYDGQTGEMLAIAQIKKGKKWGMVYDRSHQAKTLADAGWDDASEYINATMADDRR
jgi:hypothetical protein